MKKKIIQIIKLLKRKKLKISVAESCTGGMLSSAIWQPQNVDFTIYNLDGILELIW